ARICIGCSHVSILCFLSAPPPPYLYPLPLHDALPIFASVFRCPCIPPFGSWRRTLHKRINAPIFHPILQAIHTLEKSAYIKVLIDRKSTRLNSSHVKNSYAVFC